MRRVRIQRCDMGKASNKTHWRCRFRIRSRCGTTTLSRRHVATLRECAMHSERAEKNRAAGGIVGRHRQSDGGRHRVYRARPATPITSIATDGPGSPGVAPTALRRP
jgi:hypothetical protein